MRTSCEPLPRCLSQFHDDFASSAALEFISSEERGFWVNYGKGQPDEARLTRLLLDRGANHNVRASLRARLEDGYVGGPVHGVPKRDTVRLGRTVPRVHLRESRGVSVDRGERRQLMILSENLSHISDALRRGVRLLAPNE
jgi:hypothetical protein